MDSDEFVPTVNVALTDAELILLDGRCSPGVQTLVDAARARVVVCDLAPGLSAGRAGFVADAVSHAEATGRLVCRNVRLRSCKVCGRRAGYAMFKSGPRKGRANTSRPLTFAGVELAVSVVRVEGNATLGCCTECFDALLEPLKGRLADVAAEVPERLRAVGVVVYARFGRVECRCGWEGHEGELGELPAVLGGSYRGQCPSCDARNLALGLDRPISPVDGFVVVEA